MPTTNNQTFSDGARVQHIDWKTAGTVHLHNPGLDDVDGEVRWDGSWVVDELAVVADKLELI